MRPKLWEYDHDHYCRAENFKEFNSWQEFLKEYGSADIAETYIFRWDWLHSEIPDEMDELRFYMVKPAFSEFLEISILVDPAQENDVFLWLLPRYRYQMKLWRPFRVVPRSPAVSPPDAPYNDAKAVTAPRPKRRSGILP